jgi:hypothetical protein
VRADSVITRRALLAGGAGLVGALAIAGTSVGSPPTSAGTVDWIPHVRLGGTALSVSRVVLTSGDPAASEAVSRFTGAGVNLVALPAAAVRGLSPDVLRAAAAGKLVLAPRTAPDGDPAADLRAVRGVLGVAAADLLLQHVATSPDSLLDPTICRTVAGWKDAGHLRYFGLFVDAPRRPACLEAAARSGVVDVVFVPYSFRDRSNAALDRALDLCAERGLGVVAIQPRELQLRVQPYASEFERVAVDPLQAAVRHVLDDRRVHAVAVGPAVGSRLTSVLGAARHPLTGEQAAALATYERETRALSGRSTS